MCLATGSSRLCGNTDVPSLCGALNPLQGPRNPEKNQAKSLAQMCSSLGWANKGSVENSDAGIGRRDRDRISSIRVVK